MKPAGRAMTVRVATSRSLASILLTSGVVATLALLLELLALWAGFTTRFSSILLIIGPLPLVVGVLWRRRMETLEPGRTEWAIVAGTSFAIAVMVWAPDALDPLSLGRLQWSLMISAGVVFVVALSLMGLAHPGDAPQEGRHRRLVPLLVVFLLSLSFVVTALTSAVLSPLGGPDESAHYSYVKYVAENPLEFPPRFEDQLVGDGEPNHLVHPPLYYQIMAIPYQMLDVERHLTSVGVEADLHGGLSGVATIPALRAASLVLVLVHLLGLYMLLVYLWRRSVLPGWGTVLAAAALGLVPGYTFIAGTLNNDVLALAIWPFMVLFAVRYLFEGDRRFAYVSLLLAALATLTKGTLWPLILLVGAGVIATVILRVVRKARGDGSRVTVGALTGRLWSVLRPISRSDWIWFLTAVGAVALAVYYFSAMYVRYGSFQPSYTAVYGLAPEDSKFRNVPEGGIVERSPFEFSVSATTLLFRSLFGILGQRERIYDPNPEHFAYVIGVLTAVGLALSVYGLVARGPDRRHRARVWLASGFLATALVFMAIFLLRSFVRYHEHGYYGVQGRYLIGYIDLWLIGLLALAWLTLRTTRAWWSRALVGLLAAFVAVAIVWLFVDPFFYLQRTQELGDRIGIESLVEESARDEGMVEESMRPVAPEAFVEQGEDPPLELSWANARIEDTVRVEGGRCLEVWLFGEGSMARGEAPVLEVGLTGSAQETPGAVARVEVTPGLDVVTVTLDQSGAGSEDELFVTHTNFEAHQSSLLEWFTPKTRPYVSHDVYTRPVACE